MAASTSAPYAFAVAGALEPVAARLNAAYAVLRAPLFGPGEQANAWGLTNGFAAADLHRFTSAPERDERTKYLPLSWTG